MSPKIPPTVVTGSAAQVPSDLARQLGIEILPLGIYVNGKAYHDGIDLIPGELYQKMRTEKLDVKTAAPSVGEYYQRFKEILLRGGQEILCLTLSGKLSSDFSSATDAAQMIQTEFPAARVVVFESLRAAVPQGLLAIEAAKKLNEGESLDKVIEFLTPARLRTTLIAALDTLKYLAQGGRIGKAAYLVGSSLQIVPILMINDEGIVAPATIVRKKERTIPTILSLLNKHTKGYKKINIAVMHADALEQATLLQQALQDLFPQIQLPIDEFTPVMGAHAGPGLVGLGYYYE
jgi:DegV family protein with EDD domain